MVTGGMIFSSKCTKSVQRPGSSRTRWGSLSATPDPLAAMRVLLLREGRGGERRGGEGGKGYGRECPAFFVARGGNPRLSKYR